MQMFMTTEFYDHMRELNNSRGACYATTEEHAVINGCGHVVDGRITEEFTLCYEDGDRSYQS